MLVPILKNCTSNTLKEISTPSPSRVKFNLPSERASVMDYFQEDDGSSLNVKISSVVKSITSKDVEDTVIQKWLIEFKDNILFLDKNAEAIVYALLKFDWYMKDDTFVSAYQDLILNLVTAHSIYLRNVLMMILNSILSISSDKECYTQDEQRALNCIHNLSRRITELIPLSQFILCSIFIDKFPYIKMPACVILHYIENMLTVCSYLPNKRNLLLACIIEKLIHIDALCSKENVEIFEFQRQENSMNMDLDQDSSLDKKSEEMAFPLAHTLDISMCCMFKFIKDACFMDGGQLNWDSTKKLYKEILTIFDKIILPTHGSCHVQYLLFYICSLKQELCDGYLDYLWKKVQNPTVAPILRQIAAFYIGSFLSRAKYINISTVVACFDLMSSWVHSYIDAHTSQDLEVHGTLHSVCQTIFYVFAFRSKELLEMKDGYKYLRSLNFDRMVTCRLNPLRFLDRNIVQNFASIARNHQIAYVYPVIERNNRNLLYSCFNSTSEETVAGAMIPTFFPFDPYFLKRSKQFIEPHYRIYNHTPKDEETVDHMEDEEMSTNDELFSYSMSPGFKKTLLPRHTNC